MEDPTTKLKSLPQVIEEAVKEFRAQTGKSLDEAGIVERNLRSKAQAEAKSLGVSSGKRGRRAACCIPWAEADILRHRLLTYLHRQSVKAGKRKLPDTEGGLSASQIELLVIGLVNALYPDFDWEEWRRDAERLPSSLLGIVEVADEAAQAVEAFYGPSAEEAADELDALSEPSPRGYVPGVGWDGETVGSEEEIERAAAALDHANEVEPARRRGREKVEEEAHEAAKASRLRVLDLARYSRGATSGG